MHQILKVTQMNVYSFNQNTNEYIGQDVADESPLEPGIYLTPALSTLISPPETAENEAAIFDRNSNSWSVVADYRIVSLWDKTTAAKVAAALGKTPDELNATQIEPTIDYPKWDEASTSWVTDEDAQLLAITSAANAEIENLLTTATTKIAQLQDAVDLGIATIEETASLTKWKTYRVLVNRVPTQSGYPTTIDWPPVPE